MTILAFKKSVLLFDLLAWHTFELKF